MTLLAGVVVAMTLLAACVGASEPGAPAARSGSAPAGSAAPAAPPSVPPSGGAPALRVETVVAGLDHPWDVAPLGGDRTLVTQRGGTLSLVTGLGPGVTARPVAADLADVYVRGESGLMGIAPLPDGTFVTCQSHQENGRPVDIRLVTWSLSPDGASATRVRDPLVGGLPLNPSGRHGGCRPTLAPDGALLVGTGDTARAPISQDRTALGGKVLRGVALAPDGTAWSVEHGPDVDDEVNVVIPGANYGWDPARGGATPGGYDESVPMTDLARYPDAVPAAWSSGDPTLATSGGTFLSGPAWGDLDGVLAVTAQKGEKLLLMRPGTGDRARSIVEVSVPAELDGIYGRLRGARLGTDGALYLTTDNGDNDSVLRVTRA